MSVSGWSPCGASSYTDNPPAYQKRFPNGKIGHVIRVVGGLLAVYDGNVLGRSTKLAEAKALVDDVAAGVIRDERVEL